MRIYWDLIGADLSVWRDQIDGEPDADFQNEFLHKIDECDVFLLIDSANYRLQSKWCSTEIERFFQSATKGDKKLFVCLVQEDGNWREPQSEIFCAVNRYKYIDFSNSEVYDNSGKYNLAINNLCNSLGVNYISWDKYPYEKDLFDELSQTNITIRDKERSIILNEYSAIRYWKQRNGRKMLPRIESFYEDCKELGVEIIFPQLILAIEYFDYNKTEKAIEVLESARDLYNSDPRIHRALGACYAKLEQYDTSINHFETAISLLKLDMNYKHRPYKKEIMQNIANVFMNSYNNEKAVDVLVELYGILLSERKLHPKIFLDIAYCYMETGNFEQQHAFLTKGVELFDGYPELHFQLGCYFNMVDRFADAVMEFQRLVRYDKSIRSYASLAYSYFLLRDEKNFHSIFQDVMHQQKCTDDDNYYTGFLYYLEGDLTKSQVYYLACETKMPSYNEIINFD